MTDDIEKQASSASTNYADELSSTASGRVQEFAPLAKLNQFAKYLGGEVRGVERVPEEEKTDPHVWTAMSMWLGGNTVVATFALGVLGIDTFGLNFADACLTIIFFTMLGALPVSFMSIFGAMWGIRESKLFYFWFGQFARVLAVLNCIASLGWNSVNTMVSAQMLHVVNDGALPTWAGVVIIMVMTFVVSFLGYRIVHIFEMYAWVPCFIVFIITAVRLGMSGNFTSLAMNTGPTEAGSVLSFGCAVYGFATGWSAFAADYTVYMRSDVSKLWTFLGVYASVCLPCFFGMMLGAACMTGGLSDPTWQEHYDKNSVGGLFFAVLVDNSMHGFGQFCVVLLALSTVANNIPNMYSMGLSCQAVWSKMAKVPRVVYTTIGCGISIAIAIPAYMHFAAFMHNFMNLIAYWLAILIGCVLPEHFLFRKGFSGYNPDRYDDPTYLPLGIAGTVGFLSGVGGAIVGMSQVWFMGPVAKLIGDPASGGGDVGLELGFAFALIMFTVTRYFELKFIGR